MRVTFRAKPTRVYWEERWSKLDADEPMENENVYPLKYALEAIQSDEGRVLEAGCGPGRVLRNLQLRGHSVVGIDYVSTILDRLRSADADLCLGVADVRHLPFRDGAFRYVLAFGLYHNLESGLSEAIRETHRVLQQGGRVCASFRADNIETRLTDWLKARGEPPPDARDPRKYFHKFNMTASECAELWRNAGFVVEQQYPVANMPFLYHFPVFRSVEHRSFNESVGRKKGYELSWPGQLIVKLAHILAPTQFCDVFVFILRKL